MIDRNLTIERGLEEIGAVRNNAKVVLTAESSLVQACKEYRQRLNELLAEGKIYLSRGVLGSPVKGVILSPIKVHYRLEDNFLSLSGDPNGELVMAATYLV